jgi:hypothetical protein
MTSEALIRTMMAPDGSGELPAENAIGPDPVLPSIHQRVGDFEAEISRHCFAGTNPE